MGLINAIIDTLDKEVGGEQAMQRKIDGLNRSIERLREEKEELLRIQAVRAKADVAWERAFAERTGGTVTTNPRPGSDEPPAQRRPLPAPAA